MKEFQVSKFSANKDHRPKKHNTPNFMACKVLTVPTNIKLHDYLLTLSHSIIAIKPKIIQEQPGGRT